MKLLRITIDENLSFMKHIADIYMLANNRLRALAIIRRLLSTKQTNLFEDTNIFI